ncbi:MAG: cytidine deaminase [Candidatus Nomurabacteria bacterium]|jgi:dCMP deaminase|nr:cytidine deaminase [Candidatus Nomurabacteria bacterium]
MTEIIGLVRPLKRLAKTSRSKRCQVACFFIKNGAIISSGVNHNPTGQPMEDLVDGKLVSRPEVVHAEVAAIEAARQNGVNLAGSTLLLTTSPCINCARQIAELNIAQLDFLYEWWDKAALELLRSRGIKIKQIKEL